MICTAITGPRQMFIFALIYKFADPSTPARVVHSPGRHPRRRPQACKTGSVAGANARFLTLADVADVLNVTVRQVYALVRSGDLRGIQIGGRGQWRIENSELEEYIARQYARTDKLTLDQGSFDRDLTTDS